MPRRRFADTFYFLALLSPRDVSHEEATEMSRALPGEVVTTDAVLIELADAMSSPYDRDIAAATIQAVWDDPAFNVRSIDRGLLKQAMALYASRADKDWGLTDCISFVVMREEQITEALTADTHFRQAGFRILFPQS